MRRRDVHGGDLGVGLVGAVGPDLRVVGDELFQKLWVDDGGPRVRGDHVRREDVARALVEHVPQGDGVSGGEDPVGGVGLGVDEHGVFARDE